MKVDVGKLKSVEGLAIPLDVKCTPQELSEHELFSKLSSDLEFKGTIINADRTILIEGVLSCGIIFPCDRCGDDVAISIVTNISEKFSNLAISEDESLDINYFNGDMIDLLPVAERTVYLELPMKVLCKEDCKGLCVECGINLNHNQCSCNVVNIDPRLAALEDLMKELL